MFENEEIRSMNIQKTAKIRDDLCFLIHKEEFSQRAVNAVRDITETETNMTDALKIRKKLGQIDFKKHNIDLFFSNQLIDISKDTQTLIAVCTCNNDFKRLLEEITVPWCVNDFNCYKEIVVLTNFWSSKVFEKYKRDVLDFSIEGDVKIGFYLVTDYGFSKILRIS